MSEVKPYFRYENTNNEVVDLTQEPFVGELANDLFAYKWNYITQGQAIQRIVKFEKAMITRKFRVLITGKDETEYRTNIDRFLHITDVDINNIKMGRLYVGDYYLECYIFASAKPKRYLNTNKTLVELNIVCENGNWQKEYMHLVRSDAQTGVNGEHSAYGFNYPYDYDYDYTSAFGENLLSNESYMDTDFELTFYGIMEHPIITIGGNTYDINYPVGEKERLVINSQKKTAVLIRANGEEVNVFRFRNTDHYIYQKIKGGNSLIVYDNNEINATGNGNVEYRSINIDIKLFIERSEPKWSSGIWT